MESQHTPHYTHGEDSGRPWYTIYVATVTTPSVDVDIHIRSDSQGVVIGTFNGTVIGSANNNRIVPITNAVFKITQFK